MLYDLIKPYTSVSTIGMCKNAGKTTVLNRIVSECSRRGEDLGLTSIGRDGERSDLVTGTKKPEIYVFSGTLIATAAAALDLGDISREILLTTGMPTPMGEIVVARAHSDGFVQLAGPSMTAQLRSVKDKLLEFGAARVIIDGALSRKSLAMPAVSAGTILSSGASYSRDMQKTVGDTAYAALLMELPKTERRDVVRDAALKYTVFAADCTGSGENEGRFLYETAEEAADGIRQNAAKAVYIKGGVTDRQAEALFSAGRALAGAELIVEDGSRLLVSRANYQKLLRAGARVTALDGTKLIAVTVNPFSAYGDHYDKNAFFDAVRRALPETVRVMNVLEDARE